MTKIFLLPTLKTAHKQSVLAKVRMASKRGALVLVAPSLCAPPQPPEAA